MFTYTHNHWAREQRLIFQVPENPKDEEKIKALDDLDPEKFEALVKSKDTRMGLAKDARDKDERILKKVAEDQRDLESKVDAKSASTGKPDAATELAEGAAGDFEDMMRGKTETVIQDEAEGKNSKKEERKTIDVKKTTEEAQAEGVKEAGNSEAVT
jgi:hypothetical protein